MLPICDTFLLNHALSTYTRERDQQLHKHYKMHTKSDDLQVTNTPTELIQKVVFQFSNDRC